MSDNIDRDAMLASFELHDAALAMLDRDRIQTFNSIKDTLVAMAWLSEEGNERLRAIVLAGVQCSRACVGGDEKAQAEARRRFERARSTPLGFLSEAMLGSLFEIASSVGAASAGLAMLTRTTARSSVCRSGKSYSSPARKRNGRRLPQRMSIEESRRFKPQSYRSR